MKIYIPHDWASDEVTNLSITIKAQRFVYAIGTRPTVGYKRKAIRNFFNSYALMYEQKKFPDAMRKPIAINVFEFAVLIGKYHMVFRDDIEIIWREVSQEEIWNFTKNSFP